MNKLKNILLLVSVIIITGLSILVYFQKQKLSVVPAPVIITDTITITEFKDKIIYKEHFDTIFTVDTIYIDSSGNKQVQVELPIEHKVAEFTTVKDSLELHQKIFYTGWRASIDSSNVDYHFTYKSVPERPKLNVGWSLTIGPSVGYDIVFLQDGRYKYGPTIGINATFGIGFTKNFK